MTSQMYINLYINIINKISTKLLLLKFRCYWLSCLVIKYIITTWPLAVIECTVVFLQALILLNKLKMLFLKHAYGLLTQWSHLGYFLCGFWTSQGMKKKIFTRFFISHFSLFIFHLNGHLNRWRCIGLCASVPCSGRCATMPSKPMYTLEMALGLNSCPLLCVNMRERVDLTKKIISLKIQKKNH